MPAFTLTTEQGAIAASHETQPGFDQANGPGAQIVRFPAPIGNAVLAKQALRDFAIAVSIQRAIDCTQAKDELVTAPERQRQSGRSEGPPFERQPKSMSCPQTNPEIGVER